MSGNLCTRISERSYERNLKKKLLFLKSFFLSSERLTFEKENVIF